MKKFLLLIILIFSLIILGCETVPHGGFKFETHHDFLLKDTLTLIEPIPIGSNIYEGLFGTVIKLEGKLHAFNGHGARYSYAGMENNNIRIAYKFEYLDTLTKKAEVLENRILMLPLDSKKRALLRIEFGKYQRDLLITVVDEFNRITVEEIGETQTK